MTDATCSTGAQISTGTANYRSHARAYERGTGYSVLFSAPVLDGHQRGELAFSISGTSSLGGQAAIDGDTL